ncbi:hypothetical protein CKO35_02550 [Ectothiorhodospira shaposhnikovii]|uniref:hypothetical protein n=1 Tax=Ectothiorhodospira shaposhnikovii TaxID=1054 RepID=UPI001908030D|nr:hypothetical protein [Ectothiorhodospira shaposhnikovii]MBK1672196.1 hypothetical protein [Ectothiorhodospira shaposhnikovii]
MRIGIGILVFLAGLAGIFYALPRVPPELGMFGVLWQLSPYLGVMIVGLGIFAYGRSEDASIERQ